MVVEHIQISQEEVMTSALYNVPSVDSTAILVLAHGSSQGMRSDLFDGVSNYLALAGISVFRFNFPYIEMERRTPDRSEKLESCFQAALSYVEKRSEEKKIFIGGKSLGARIAVKLASTSYRPHGVVCLGYPFHPPGKPDRINGEVIRTLNVPTLFLQGEKDPFAKINHIRPLIEESRQFSLIEISGGDHSFNVKNQSNSLVHALLSRHVETFITKLSR
ncbi:MAG: hypothetical protein CL896_05555 [Dehalococcoidia bacterium]|nr:hypothetical protein [Dehalococcoidia bacterium]